MCADRHVSRSHSCACRCTTATGASAYGSCLRASRPKGVGVIRPCFALAEMRVPVSAGTQYLSRFKYQIQARFCSSGESKDKV